MRSTLFLLGILIIIGLQSCKDGGIPMPVEPPVVKKCSVEIIFGPNGSVSPAGNFEMAYGTTKPIAIQPSTGCMTYITVNNGTKTLFTSTVYQLSPTSDTKIKVEFEKSPALLLTQKPWIEIKYEKRWVGTSIWYDYVPFRDKFTFFSNERYTIHDVSNKLIGDGSWKLFSNNDSIIMGGDHRRVSVLTEDTLKIISLSKFYPSPGGPIYPDSQLQSTYIH